MSLSSTHAFVSAKTDGADPTKVQPSNWNADHETKGFRADTLGDFTPQTDVAIGMVITSDELTIATSDNSDASSGRVFALCVRGDGEPQVQVNSLSWSDYATARTGDTVKVRMTSSLVALTETQCNLYIDEDVANFTITTQDIFYPNSIESSHFNLWYDPTEVTSIHLDGSSNLQQLDDLSGAGFHATQSTSGSRGVITPSGLDGKPVIDMSASGKSIQIPSGWLSAINTGGDKFSLVFIVKITGTGSYSTILDTTSRQFSFFLDTSSDLIHYVQVGIGTAGNLSPTVTLTENVWHLVSIVGDATNVTVWVDGKYGGSRPQGGTFSEYVSMGANPSGGGNAGLPLYAEELGWKVNLGTTDREKIEGYLAHRWGLEGNLDVSHPYKTFPP